jgi:hypothetical protein
LLIHRESTVLTKTKRKPPQHPWLRREALNRSHEDTAPVAPEPVSVGPRLLDRHQVCEIVGASYPSIWTWMRDGKFPRSRIAMPLTRKQRVAHALKDAFNGRAYMPNGAAVPIKIMANNGKGWLR